MNYLIAFDKFKGALRADDAAAIARDAIRSKDPSAQIECAPLSDGGEGFASVLAEALGGELREVQVPGPRFEPVKGRFALVDAKRLPRHALERLNLHVKAASGLIGFVEMASASGYECLTPEQRDPWQTSTLGTGRLMQAAVKAGAKALILGIGGSATNDCGAGALEALGVSFYDRDLQPVTEIVPAKFRQVTSAGSMSHLLNAFPPVRIACDVSNPLLGPNGATRVFGPQKGLKPEDIERMEHAVQRMAVRLLGLFGRNTAHWDRLLAEPGTGAAGGIGFALRHALPDAAFVEGFALVADLLDLPAKVRAADVILTGEGRLDASSLGGKGPVALLRMADVPKQVLLFAGSLDPTTAGQLKRAHPNLRTIAISDPAWPLGEALRKTPAALQQAVTAVL